MSRIFVNRSVTETRRGMAGSMASFNEKNESSSDDFDEFLMSDSKSCEKSTLGLRSYAAKRRRGLGLLVILDAFSDVLQLKRHRNRTQSFGGA